MPFTAGTWPALSIRGDGVAADAVDLMIDTLPEMAARVGKPPDTGLRIRIITSDPARDLVLAVDEAVTLDPWDDGPADGVSACRPKHWCASSTGASTTTTPAPSRSRCDGLRATLRSVFPGSDRHVASLTGGS